jgi:hypothetical protein
MLEKIEKGEMFFEVHAICGKCERRIRISEKVRFIEEAEGKLKKANWIKTEQSGWICFVCKEMPGKTLGDN